MRIQLVTDISGHSLTIIFLGTFLVSCFVLTVKAADLSSDMMIALLQPLYSISIVFQMIGRDMRSSIIDIKSQVVGYDLDFPRHSHESLVTIYRVYRSFKRLSTALATHMITSIVLWTLWALLAQRLHCLAMLSILSLI